MIKTKKLSYGILVLFIFLFMLGFASAVTTLNTPAANSVVAGSAVSFNVTTTDVSNVAVQLANITFYAQSTLTANSTWVVIGQNNSVNLSTTNNQSVGAFSVAYGILEDSNNYIFNVTIANSTSGAILGSDTNTGITVDNTIPQAPTALGPTGTVTNGTFVFTGTVVGRNTTSCTLRFNGVNPGSLSYAMTHSGDTCTYSSSNIPEQSYTWFVRASDETNTTDATSVTTRIDVKTSAGKSALLAQQENVKSLGGSEFAVTEPGVGKILGMPAWLVIVILVVVVIFIVKNRRK